jgi:hypothetical protein
MLSTPSSYAIGIDARLIARPRSPAIRMGRRRRRSTQTPAGSEKRRNGRNSIVPRSATSNGGACSTRIATVGIARRLTWVPNWLIVSADQSFRKSGWRKSPRREAVTGDLAGRGSGVGTPGERVSL